MYYRNTHCINTSSARPGSPRMPTISALTRFTAMCSPRRGLNQVQGNQCQKAQGGVGPHPQRQPQRRGEQLKSDQRQKKHSNGDKELFGNVQGFGPSFPPSYFAARKSADDGAAAALLDAPQQIIVAALQGRDLVYAGFDQIRSLVKLK